MSICINEHTLRKGEGSPPNNNNKYRKLFSKTLNNAVRWKPQREVASRENLFLTLEWSAIDISDRNWQLSMSNWTENTSGQQ